LSTPLCFTVAVESRRLSFMRSHDATTGEHELPLTIFVLLTIFYDQPQEGENMKGLGTAMSLTTYGVGSLLSSGILSVV
jgi:peptide/histidine transporter 3/4